MDISNRGQKIQPSPIRKLKPYADKAQERGIHVYFINIGQPDIPTPQSILDAFHSFDEKVLSYGPAQGFLELRQAIADYFVSYNIPLDSENVIITLGGSEAIHFSFCVVADPGDEIIIPEPFYTNYNGYASYADVKISPLTLRVEDGFRLPPAEEIEARITPKTRAILLCSPNNPTGTVYTPEELERVISIVKKHDLFLGARIGAVVTRNSQLYQSLLRFAQARLCPPTVEQKAALAAYRMGLDYFQPVRDEYERRRDVLYEGLKDIPGIVIHKPQGAFYIIVRLPVKDAEHFVLWMLRDFHFEQETVMVAPAQGFYCTPGKGKDEVRIAYVLKEQDLRRAIIVFKEGLNKYLSIFS